MKFLSIGDLHGKTDWKIPVLGYDSSTNTGSKTTIDDFDKVIFIGDYVDDFRVGNVEMKQNLLDVIELKKKYQNKVVLLLGNHDLQYLLGYKRHGCSGYRPEMAFDFGDIFRSNRELFVASYEYKNYLWTHAGIHIGWYRFRFLPAIKDNNMEKLTLSQQINSLFEMEHDVLFDVGYDRGGSFNVGGPFWADKRMTIDKPLDGYHQIVGHSRVKEIKTIVKKENTSITFIDVLDTIVAETYILNIG